MRIVYIDIDTLRPDHLGCYGYHRNTSPNIDRVAKEGTIFSQCYASDVPCLPSRASLFTGRFGIHTGIVGHGGTTADFRVTGSERGFMDQEKELNWVALLKKKGFYTVSVSPYAERHSAYWFYSGWNEMYNPGLGGAEIADLIYKYAEKWLVENAKRDKWFLHVNFWDPHTPYRTPKKFGYPFQNDPPPSWLTEEIIESQRESYGPHSAREPHGFGFEAEDKFFWRVMPRGKVKEIQNLSDFKEWVDGYDVGIRYADEYIGKIISILKKFEIYDDTLIIISSDHGENQGELNIYGDHMTACHCTSRVPMIIKWPGKNWRNRYDQLIYATDIAATLLEGLNIAIPESWDGKSFYKKIESDDNIGREFLVLSQNAWSCQRAVRFENWTLVKTYHTGLKNFPEIMLFDFKRDFHMTKNLVDEKPEIVKKGINLLDKWHDLMMSTSYSKIDPMETVLQEGGPFHSRGYLERYLKRLRDTGREHLVNRIISKNEPY